jgi:hypothetical protein
MCSDCHDGIPGHEYLTEINPRGGYGREQVLVCDGCMRSGRWDEWKAQKWPNWPNLPKSEPVE